MALIGRVPDLCGGAQIQLVAQFIIMVHLIVQKYILPLSEVCYVAKKGGTPHHGVLLIQNDCNLKKGTQSYVCVKITFSFFL